MQRFRLFQFVLAVLATGLVAGLTGAPARAQAWSVTEPGDGAASARICPLGEEGSDSFLCFRLECAAFEPLHFALDVAGRGVATEKLGVTLGVDGGDVGVLTFAPHAVDGYTRYTASFDPRLHEELVDLLQRGLRASLRLDWPDGVQDVEVGLTGSSDSLYTVMETCPMPSPPVDNPASLVLGEVVAACGELGGTVAMEPGFERREDLDGDGREDLVIDYAAAACTESATLNCGSGGCTVGFFLARDEGYIRMFADVIRGYEVFPGGFLALDLHGTACGLYGFEACRKVFDIAGNAPVLVEEIAGPEAETMTVASTGDAEDAEGAEDAEADPDAPEAVVVAVTEGVTVEPEAVAPAVEAADEPVIVEIPAADAPVVEIPVADAPAAPAAATPDTAPEAAPDTAPEAAPDTAPEAETVTIAAVTPEAAPVVPAAPDPTADAGTEAVIVTAAATSDADEGPSSRHDAGPAPAVPASAEFRGDGTLVVPEEAGQ